MFDKLDEIVKTDTESQTRYEEIKNQFHAVKNSIAIKAKRRARIVAVVIAFLQIVSILILIYAFAIKGNYETKIDNLEHKISNLESKLENCQ